jgi:hypothetical protein
MMHLACACQLCGKDLPKKLLPRGVYLICEACVASQNSKRLHEVFSEVRVNLAKTVGRLEKA